MIYNFKILNPDKDGCACTIKANYYKMSAYNILFKRCSGFMAMGVLIEYEF